MGLSFIFCAGSQTDDTKNMLDALEAADYQTLNQRMARKADFSLHLIPRDLQTLSECATAFSSHKAVPFREGLTCYFDAEDRGFFIVSEEWEQFIAAIDPQKANALTEAWFQAMRAYDPEVKSPPPEAVAAVKDLIELCQYAGQTGKPVVHIWTA